MPPPTLLCTVRNCRLPLHDKGPTWRCANNHTFDVARSGYLNLLQPQDRRSRTPGDSPEAVASRRRFYDRGFDAPLLQATLAFASTLSFQNGDAILDVGCGDGHHLDAFRSMLGQSLQDLAAEGVDISVPAVDAAARRYADCRFVVANADRFLPYEDGSFALVMSITSRLTASELRRVTRADGHLLVVIAGPDDLLELRGAILGEAVSRDRVQRTTSMFAETFSLVRHERVRHIAELDHEAIVDVMTSSYRGLRAKERTLLDEVPASTVTLERDLLLFAPR
jgi:23S rRNA (guanine745-N1)-methyltransferase